MEPFCYQMLLAPTLYIDNKVYLCPILPIGDTNHGYAFAVDPETREIHGVDTETMEKVLDIAYECLWKYINSPEGVQWKEKTNATDTPSTTNIDGD